MVVMNILKLSLYDKVLSPKVIDKDPELFTTCCSKIGSKDLSNSLPTFSSKNHLPFCTASYSVFISFESYDSFTMSMPSMWDYRPIDLMNLFAWP